MARIVSVKSSYKNIRPNKNIFQIILGWFSELDVFFRLSVITLMLIAIITSIYLKSQQKLNTYAWATPFANCGSSGQYVCTTSKPAYAVYEDVIPGSQCAINATYAQNDNPVRGGNVLACEGEYSQNGWGTGTCKGSNWSYTSSTCGCRASCNSYKDIGYEAQTSKTQCGINAVKYIRTSGNYYNGEILRGANIWCACSGTWQSGCKPVAQVTPTQYYFAAY